MKPLLICVLMCSFPAFAQAPPPVPQTAKVTVRAQYNWGYSGMDGEGSGTLSVLVEPETGKVVMELHGLGERLMLLTGNQSGGYHIQIPRRELDRMVASFNALPLPFLPQLGSSEALYRLLSEGVGPGVKVTKRDAQAPLKLRYQGRDEQGKDVMVWMNRTRWEVN
jgi:hypothetical protein